MKKKTIIFALVASLSVCCLSGCTDDDKTVGLSDYWRKNWAVSEPELDEMLTYKVTFKAEGGVDTLSYTLAYGEGKYEAHLKATAGGKSYLYETKLEIPVTYTYGEEQKTFVDEVTTSVQFKEASKQLQPVSSEKTVLSHSPTSESVTEISDCYSYYHFDVRTAYAESGEATSTVRVYPEKAEGETIPESEISTSVSTFQYGGGDYSYLDNEQLWLALRAVSSSTSSGTVKTYNPFLESKQSVKFSFDETVSEEFSHTRNGQPLTDKTFSYRPVSLSLDQKNSGATQTAWIARVEDAGKNEKRNVILRMETPLSYSLGSLVYELTDATYA